MEAEKDKLTQKIQQRLRDFEKRPPEHVWESIRTELSQNAATKNGGMLIMFRKHWYVALALAAAVLFLLFMFSFASDAGIYNTPLQNNTQVADNNDQIHLNTLNSIIDLTLLSKKSSDIQIAPRKRFTISQVVAASSHKDVLMNFSRLESYNAEVLPETGQVEFIDTRSSAWVSGNFESVNNEPEITNTENFSANLQGSDKWSFGFFATPELLYGKTNASGGQPSYSADFAVMYKFDQYFVQSGFSVQAANDNANANINYLQTEFMGSYQDVYDVTFDTTNGTPRPVYHTQEVEVYDTTQHQTSTLYTNSYNYLNVPLLMGYKQRFNQRFAYSVKAGPLVSFMLHEKSKYSFNYQNAQIQDIHNMPADRMTTNWQALLSFGLHYKVHRQVHFTVEPQMKYYFNPVYNTQSRTTKANPFAVGLRTGLIVGF